VVNPNTLESMVLLLVYQGVKTIEEISEELGEPKEKLARLLDKLEITGYLVSYKEGFIKKQQKYELTDQGLRIAFKFKEKAENDLTRATELASRGLLEEAKDLARKYASYVKPLIKLGVISPRVSALISSDIRVRYENTTQS
jgi:DNA-binding PadR family transcriptional regulator